MNRRLLTTTGLGFFAGVLLAGSASAADIIPTYVEPEQRIDDAWRIAITPRFWYFLENDVYFQDFREDLQLAQQSNETIAVPFAGGSISITPPGLGGTTFSLTALYGEGSGDVRGANSNIPGLGTLFESTVDMSRLDIEGIAQLPIAEGVSGILGARFINFRRDEELRRVAPPPPGPFQDFFLEQNFYLGEFGFGVSRPAWDRFVFFGNITGMVGYADLVDQDAQPGLGVFNIPPDAYEGGVAGVDTNAGVGISFSENLLLSGRYRLFYLSNPDFEFEEGGTFIHGPEVNLTISFGS